MSKKIELRLGTSSQEEFEIKSNPKYFDKHVIIEEKNPRNVVSYHKILFKAYQKAMKEGFKSNELKDFYVKHPNQDFAYVA